MIHIRPAVGSDAQDIREIFLRCYGDSYPYEQFYDIEELTRMIYSNDSLLLVAEDSSSKKVLGTASVILEVGAYSDLVGEMGRLAVHPEARNRGIGKLLMQERLRLASPRLHVALIDGRTHHPFTLKIAEGNDFLIVGFLPMKMKLQERESLVLLARYFSEALKLRKNHPRIIPEVYSIAHQAMENCGLEPDLIVAEDAHAYPHCEEFELQELSTRGYISLLRIERGRVKHREVFGPMRLHDGFFKLQARQSHYLLAREEGRIVGAIGYTLDNIDGIVRIFELIAFHDEVIRFLLESLVNREWEQPTPCYMEIDINAFSPRMQRTVLELGFLPVAYIPALAFHEVERIDVVKMAKILTPLQLAPMDLSPKAEQMANLVLKAFAQRAILPRLAEVVEELPLFHGLKEEQNHRLAGLCSTQTFQSGEVIFHQGDPGREIYIILEGEVSIVRGNDQLPLGTVLVGECLGEVALLTQQPHSASAITTTATEVAILSLESLKELIRQRPDIGVVIYQNLAIGIGNKLCRADQQVEEKLHGH